MPITGSVGSGGVNRRDDTLYIQKLLNQQKGNGYSYGPIAVDGLVGSQTIGAISNFQKNVVGFDWPDGRVDPGYQTIAALEKGPQGKPGGKPRPGPQVSTAEPLPQAIVRFQHGGVRPPVASDPGPTTPGESLFESLVSITLNGRMLIMRGSIYPDDMNNYGRIRDGRYPIFLGFHGQTGTPTQEDLVYKITGPRMPALIINEDNRVPIISDNAGIPTSGNLHIHRSAIGSTRGSNGCLTIPVGDWERFIRFFLENYTELEDWTNHAEPCIGAQCGTLIVSY